MDDFEDMEREAQESMDTDQDNFNRALDHMIDAVSSFKANGGDDFSNIKPEAWGEMLQVLDFARFIMSGIMYSYGISICGHDHSDED